MVVQQTIFNFPAFVIQQKKCIVDTESQFASCSKQSKLFLVWSSRASVILLQSVYFQHYLPPSVPLYDFFLDQQSLIYMNQKKFPELTNSYIAQSKESFWFQGIIHVPFPLQYVQWNTWISFSCNFVSIQMLILVIFIVILLQLSQFFPLCPPLPNPPPAPTVNSHTVVHVHGSFTHVLCLLPCLLLPSPSFHH